MLRHHPPAPDAEQLAEDALRLKPKQRARLAELLYTSIKRDAGVLAANEKEAGRWLKDAENSKSKLVPWPEARKLAFGRTRRI